MKISREIGVRLDSMSDGGGQIVTGFVWKEGARPNFEVFILERNLMTCAMLTSKRKNLEILFTILQIPLSAK